MVDEPIALTDVAPPAAPAAPRRPVAFDHILDVLERINRRLGNDAEIEAIIEKLRSR